MTRILVALAAVAVLAGCGTTEHIDNTRLEGQIHAWAVKKQQADPSVKVNCPPDIPIKAGATFHCLISVGKQTVRLAVTIENSDGDVTWVIG